MKFSGKKRPHYHFRNSKILNYFRVLNSKQTEFHFDLSNVYDGIQLKKNGVILTNDYMDDNVRGICSIIAIDLREILDRNVYFNLINGKLIFNEFNQDSNSIKSKHDG